jgi:hypothetical protein
MTNLSLVLVLSHSLFIKSAPPRPHPNTYSLFIKSTPLQPQSALYDSVAMLLHIPLKYFHVAASVVVFIPKVYVHLPYI